MSDFPILSMVTFLPLLGAGIILAFNRGTPEETATPARYMALWTSLITFLLSLFLTSGSAPYSSSNRTRPTSPEYAARISEVAKSIRGEPPKFLRDRGVLLT